MSRPIYNPHIDFFHTSDNIEDNVITDKCPQFDIDRMSIYEHYKGHKLLPEEIRQKIREEAPDDSRTYRITINGNLLTHLSTIDNSLYYELIRNKEFINN